MKKFIFSVIFSLGQGVFAQGVMPVPGTYEFIPDCQQRPLFSIMSEAALSPFKINLSPLICDEETLFADAFKITTNNYHDSTRCEEIELCANSVSEREKKEAENIIADNISRAVLIGVLTKEVAENRGYNAELLKYELKNKVKVCEEEKIDFQCDVELRRTLATVADSLVGFPEFTIAPSSEADLREFIPNQFFSKLSRTAADKSLAELKKNCSLKFSLKKVCENSRKRLKVVNFCDKSFSAKNCFEDEQLAWASITNDLKGERSLFLAIEKQLCLPSRISNSTTQALWSYPILFETKSERAPQTTAYFRRQQLLTSASLNAEINAGTDKGQEKDTSPSASGVIKQESFSLGDGFTQAAANSEVEEIQGIGSRDSTTLSESFSNSVDQTLGGNEDSGNSSVSNNMNQAWNNELINRARAIAEEQKALEEDKKRNEEKNENSSLKEDKKKQEELDSLMSQINGLKSKLDEMNTKMEELKEKKAAGEAAGVDQESALRETAILDLKKKIAELEADKKQKEEKAQAARVEEAKIAREKEEKSRNTYSAPSMFGTQSSYKKQNSAEQATEASVYEREKTASSMSAPVSSSSGGRAPASISAPTSSASSASAQIVLKAVGSQASPESNIVYMTPNELKRYPYRLGDKATPSEIEKMLEGNKGLTIILGESEQIVPIIENGVIAVDETGKIKYKRIKISLVKNDKEVKQQIAREISSIADLKKEEQRKRDLIRYQEMKKALKLK